MSKRPRPTLTPSSGDSALDDLKENGYFWLRRAVPEHLASQCACAIEQDVGSKLDQGSVHQEEPHENLEKSTAEIMLKMRDYVCEQVLGEQVSAR